MPTTPPGARLRRGLGAALGLLLLAPSAAAEGGEPSWYTQALARGRAGINVTHFWSKGSKLRTETVVGGHKIITIVNGELYYAYDALGMSGVAIRRAAAAIAQDSPDRRPFGNELETLQLQGAEHVGEEELFGTTCDLYRVTDKAGRRELWVTKDRRALPVRIQIYDRRTASTKLTDFVNWLSGIPIDDEFFEPEPTVELDRMTLEEYVRRTTQEGPVGAVPVLYADLLHGRRRADSGGGASASSAPDADSAGPVVGP